MNSFLSLLRKEFLHNRITIFLLWGVTSITILGVGMKWPTAIQFLPFGELSLFLIIWQVAGVCFSAMVFADLSVASDYRSKVDNFLETLPVSRIAVIGSKFVAVFLALTIVSCAAYLIFAFRNSEFRPSRGIGDLLPFIRLMSLNFAIAAVAICIALLGKFRWFVYSALLVAVFATAGRQDIQMLLTDSAPFSILGFEKSLGELSLVPWKELFQNFSIGLGALIAASGLGYAIQGERQQRVSGSLSCTGCLLLVTVTAIAVTAVISFSGLLKDQTIEFDSVGEHSMYVSQGRTTLKLRNKVSPGRERHPSLQKGDLQEIANCLESLRDSLAPPWWPSSFTIIYDQNNLPKRQSSSVSGSHFLFTAGKYSTSSKIVSKQMIREYLQMTTFNAFHRDRYGCVFAGLGKYISTPESDVSKMNSATPQLMGELELLGPEALHSWLRLEKAGKPSEMENLSYVFLTVVRRRLDESEFEEWLQKVGQQTLIRPSSSTIIDWDKGITYWAGAKNRGAVKLLPTSIEVGPLFEEIKQRLATTQNVTHD